MKTKKWILVLFLLFVSNIVFPLSPRHERFSIHNYSSKNVVVNVEFWKRTDCNIENELNYADHVWHQTILDISVSITDKMAIVHNNVILPDNWFPIIEYFPVERWGSEKYEKMFAMPFMDKMRAIFKKLEIIYNDGESIVTLENLGEKIIKKWGDTYMLEIFDYELVGKPGSEW